MTDVFISYSRVDSPSTRRVFAELEQHDRQSWVDWEGIPLTADWWEEIKRGIEAADTFVFVTSNHSLGSVVCNLEVAHAISTNKRIVPIMIEEQLDNNGAFARLAGYDPDEAMKERLGERDILIIARDNWRTISKLNWVSLRPGDDFNTNFSELLNAISTDLDYLKQHTSLLVEARRWEQNVHDDSYLLLGENLAHAEQWLAASGSKDPKPTELHTQYIVASRTAETERQRNALRLQRRATNRLRYFLGSLLLLVIVGTALSVFSIVNLRAAQVASAQSESIGIAANALLQNDVGQSELIALLAIRALRTNYSLQAETTLGRALENLSTIRVFGDHPQRVRTVAFSPDGQQVLTGSYDESLQVWERESGQLVWEISLPEAVMSAAFSDDGRWIVAADFNGDVVLLDRFKGAQSFAFQNRDVSFVSGMVLTVTFSHDGRFIAAGSQTGSIFLLDAATGNLRLRWSGSRNFISSLAFSRDDRELFAASGDRMIRVWDTQGQALRQYEGHGAEVMTLALSHNGRLLASGGADNTIRLWDVASGAELRQFLGSSDTVRSVAFSPDDRFIVSGGMDNIGRIWAVDTGQMVRLLVGHGQAKDVLPLDGRSGSSTAGIFSVAYSPDGQHILTGGWDGAARLWQIQDRRFDADMGTVASVAFSPDSRTLLSGSGDTTVRLWDLDAQRQVRQFVGNQYAVYDVGFSADGRYVYSAGRDGAVRVWLTDTGQVTATFPTSNWDPALSPTIYSAKLSSDGRSLLAADEFGEVFLWDLVTKQLRQTFDLHPLSAIYEVAFDPTNRRFITAAYNDTLSKVYDLELDEEVRWFASDPPSQVWSAVFSPDGTQVLLGLGDGTARLFDIADYREIRVFRGHVSAVTSVAFSPDGKYLVTGSTDRTARVWDRESGAEVRQLVGHTDWVLDVAYSPDGRWLATASRDGTFRLWDANYQDFIAYACQHLFRDLTTDERTLYSLTDSPTCPQFGDLTSEPTWTPFPRQAAISSVTLPTIMPTMTPVGYFGQYNSPEYIDQVEYSPDGRYVFVDIFGGITMLDAETLQVIRRFQPDDRAGFSVSPDSRYLTVGSFGFPIRTWDILTGEQVLSYDPSTTEKVFQYSADGSSLLIPENRDGSRIQFWSTTSGSLERTALSSQDSIFDFDRDAAGNWLVVSTDDQYLVLWNMRTEQQQWRVPTNTQGNASVFISPDGRFVMTFRRSAIQFWDASTGTPLGMVIPQTSEGFDRFARSPDSRYFGLTEGEQVTVYDMVSRHPVTRIMSPSPIADLDFAPDGNSFIVGTFSGVAYRWRVSPTERPP